jgi:hypothetical protein
MFITGRSSDFAHSSKPSHSFVATAILKTVAKSIEKFSFELTAAGTVKDLHLIPF